MKTLKQCWWPGLLIVVVTLAGCGQEAGSTNSGSSGTNRPVEDTGSRNSESMRLSQTSEVLSANSPSASADTNRMAGVADAEKSGETSETSALKAMASLNPTQGNQAQGTVTFTVQDKGVRVVAHIIGLTPGDHGFHIHEKGDCSAADGSSAGEHFNPTGAPHGGPDSAQHHVGDLGNITADSSGMATLDRVFSYLRLEGEDSIVGRAIMVHSGRDDLTSQPSGDSGTRVACGVIQ